MPTTLKCTVMFGSNLGPAWSETHHLLAPDPLGPLLGYMNAFSATMQAVRRPLLANGHYMVGVRVSYRPSAKEVKSSPFKFDPVLQPNNVQPSAAPEVAVKVRMGEANNDQFSDIYLRGVWKAVITNDQLDFTSSAAASSWKQMLDTYISTMTTLKYGWQGITPALTRRGIITGYTVGADGFVTFQLLKESGPVMPATDSIVQFRAARLNESECPLNETMVVKVLSPVSVKTTTRIAAGPFISEGTWVIPGYDFKQYTGLQYLSLNRRAPGARFFQSPGRRPKKARY